MGGINSEKYKITNDMDCAKGLLLSDVSWLFNICAYQRRRIA